MNENILVVKTDLLFGNQQFQGLVTEIDNFLSIIHSAKEFLPRAQMEEDCNYKQVIPYLIFKFQDTYFLMQRRATSTEQRLKNKYTLGIGGHMRQEDMQNGSSIFDWAQREFNEEVIYSGAMNITPVGILNDDSNAVGKVHVGLVLLIEGDNPAIAIRSELKSGQLVNLTQCEPIYNHMETWSQIVYDHLKKNKAYHF